MKKKKIIIAVLFIISFSLFLTSLFKLEPDYFWHIKTGEYIYNNGIIKKDIFSWIVSNKYWMSHEWGFEIIIYSLKKIFSNYHIFIYLFSSFILLFLILYLFDKDKYYKNIPYTMLYILFFGIMFLPYIQIRPHMMSFVLLAILFYLLFDLYRNKDSNKIYFLPIISIIWANVHGGSSNLVYLFCFLFGIVGLFSFKFNKIEAIPLSKRQIKKYFIVGLLCIIGVLINIHGFKMFLYPYQNMLDSTMVNNIMEWRGTSLNYWFHYTFILFLLLMFFTMLFSKKKINLLDLVLFLVVSYLGLKSIRFWLFAPIIMSFIIFSYVKERNIEKGSSLSFIIISIFFIGVFLYSFNNISNIKYNYYLNKKVISVLKKEKPKRLFNMYDYGGELVYNDIKVFIDGRADLYSKYNYNDYLDISNLNKDTELLIDKYNFDYFLISKNFPIYLYLKNSNNYKSIYEDKEMIIYKKN